MSTPATPNVLISQEYLCFRFKSDGLVPRKRILNLWRTLQTGTDLRPFSRSHFCHRRLQTPSVRMSVNETLITPVVRDRTIYKSSWQFSGRYYFKIHSSDQVQIFDWRFSFKRIPLFLTKDTPVPYKTRFRKDRKLESRVDGGAGLSEGTRQEKENLRLSSVGSGE